MSQKLNQGFSDVDVPYFLKMGCGLGGSVLPVGMDNGQIC